MHHKVSLTDKVRETLEHLRRTPGEPDDAAMADPADPGAEVDSLSLGMDGELTGAIYCTYCGALNPVGADVCGACGEYIADQGTSLQARLHRISRYAGNSRPEVESPLYAGVLGALFASLMGREAPSPPREAATFPTREDEAVLQGPVPGSETVARAHRAVRHRYRSARLRQAETRTFPPRPSMAGMVRARRRWRKQHEATLWDIVIPDRPPDTTPFRKTVAFVILVLVLAEFVLMGLGYLVLHTH